MTKKVTNNVERLEAELERLQAEYQRFVYCVSHDLSAPLRQIDGFASLIAKRNSELFDEKTSHHFSLLSKAVEQAQAMLEALTLYSRLDRYCSERAEVSLSACIDNVLKRLQQKISDTKAVIYKDTSQDIIISGHEECICKACYYILDNAITYSIEGERPEISITLDREEENAVLHIADKGMGIDDKYRDKVFEMFQRQVTSEIKGNGVGLAITKKIVELHEGTIELLSNTPKGVTVKISLPTRNA